MGPLRYCSHYKYMHASWQPASYPSRYNLAERKLKGNPWHTRATSPLAKDSC